MHRQPQKIFQCIPILFFFWSKFIYMNEKMVGREEIEILSSHIE